MEKLAIVVMGTHNSGKSTLIKLLSNKDDNFIGCSEVRIQWDGKIIDVTISFISSSPQERNTRILYDLDNLPDLIDSHVLITAVNCDKRFTSPNGSIDTPFFSLASLIEKNYLIKMFWEYPGVSRDNEYHHMDNIILKECCSISKKEGVFEIIYDATHWISSGMDEESKKTNRNNIKNAIEKEIYHFITKQN